MAHQSKSIQDRRFERQNGKSLLKETAGSATGRKKVKCGIGKENSIISALDCPFQESNERMAPLSLQSISTLRRDKNISNKQPEVLAIRHFGESTSLMLFF